MEIWKEIHKSLNLSKYLISNQGNIKNKKTNKLLKIIPNKQGYVCKNLTQDCGNRRSFSIHRIVAHTFNKKDKLKVEVDHIDRKRSNNHANNLRWVTKKENAKNRKYNDRKNRCRKIVQITLNDKIVKKWESIKNAGDTLHIHVSGIRQACCGKLKTYKGFKWKYIDFFYDTIEGEVWKKYSINGFSCEVSNMGRVKLKGDKITYGYTDPFGYKLVNLDKPRRLHRIIMIAFKPIKKSELLKVNHKDENKSNNKLSNLEWGDNKYNVEYSSAKSVDQYTLEGCYIRSYNSISDASKYTRICASSIVNVCKNKSYKHAGGYK